MRLPNIFACLAILLLWVAPLVNPRLSHAQECSFHRECSPGELCDDGTCRDVEHALSGQGRVFWVAQNEAGASDDNPGTKDRPWETISRATRKGVLRPGDAVIVRSGTYREAIRPEVGGRPGRRITFAAYPGDDVVVTGANEANGGWTRSGSAWRRAWTQPLHSPRSSEVGQEMWRREMVVVDGEVLTAVYNRADLTPGTFFVDGTPEAPKHIYVRLPNDGTPLTYDVEVARRAVLFGPTDARNCIALSDGALGHYRLIGFHFRHAANRAQRGAVCPGSSGSLIEENLVEWTNGMGINFSGSDHMIRGNETSDNGQSGMGGVCNGCVIEYNVSNRNNWKNYPYGFEVGGGKMVKSRGTVFRHHTAIGNNGPGIWLDHLNYRNVIVNSYIADNYGHGVFLEFESDSNIVAGNVIVGNRYRNNNASGNGVSVTASSQNLIAYNTFLGNEGSGVFVRTDTRAAARGNHVFNNLMLDNAQGAVRGIRAHEFSIQGSKLEESRSTRADGNAYTHRPASEANADNATFCYGPKPAGAGNIYTNKLLDWQATSLGGNRSLLIDDALPSVLDYRNLAKGWRLGPDSQLRGKATPLPSGWWDTTIGSFIAEDLDGHARPASGGDIGADQFFIGRAGGASTARVARPEIVAASRVNPDGRTFFGRLRVELRAGDGAEVRYTLDGSEPTARSSRYGGAALELDRVTTVKARAYRGGSASAVASETFLAKARPPEVHPGGGSFPGPVWVSLSTSTAGAAIYYTLDGSKPTPQTRRYRGPFEVGERATLKAAAYKPGLQSSNATRVDFIINDTATTQRIGLRKGWNLVSTFVEPTNPRLGAVLADAKNDVALVRNGAGQTFNPALGTGGLAVWKSSEAYAIYAHREVSFTVTGQPASPDTLALPLQAGWNTIPYPGRVPAPVQEVLASIASSLILVKDADGQVYHPEYGIKTLHEMQPGKGYRIYLAGEAMLVYPDL